MEQSFFSMKTALWQSSNPDLGIIGLTFYHQASRLPSKTAGKAHFYEHWLAMMQIRSDKQWDGFTGLHYIMLFLAFCKK